MSRRETKLLALGFALSFCSVTVYISSLARKRMLRKNGKFFENN